VHELKNMTKCIKASTSWCECCGVYVRGLNFINVILGLFFLLVLEKQKLSCKAFSVNRYRKGERRNLLQRLIDDSLETRSVASANPYYTQPCRTFCYITPCSVFASVLLLVYIANNSCNGGNKLYF